MTKWTPKNVMIVGGAALVVAWYLQSKARETVAAVGHAVNPVNQDNVFNSWFNSAYRAVTGSSGTAGTDIAGWLNGDG